MISIRAHLLWTLLPAFVGIGLAAGFGVYYSTKAELEARLDARLAGIAVDLRFAPEPPNREGGRGWNGPDGNEPRGRMNLRTGGNRGTGPVQFTDALFTNLPSNVYCELWLGNRDVKLKSAELDGDIVQPAAVGDEPVFYDAVLNNGEPFRVWASRLSVTHDKRRPRVILAVSRDETDETLKRLARNLAVGGIEFCLLLSGMLMLALRTALRPLHRLGDQVEGMDAESLNKRFPEKDIPSDIRPIVGRLNNLMAKLEESFARERRFSGDLAHELRTPLAAIRTTSEVAIKWPDQASAEDFEEIHNLSCNLQQILESLLLLARVESSDAEAIRESLPVSGLAHDCIALCAEKARERGLVLIENLDGDRSIESDPRLLRIIVSNLVNNAVEYAPEHSEIELTIHPDGALFQCANDAPDLTPEDIPRLFDRMWRKDTVRTESSHSGLGLSIAKTAAASLGLTLEATLDANQRLCISLGS
ncbi:Sensor kinase CusS [Pontiella desulfatans]|uniref:histidine kinase n=1 Tax=Pontiella desulfatans TaxID=2750659 RepID=A0A6C2UCJ4_PONDE|nr:ATP-binding protein [Pontiella desulfatans]VGO17629.1 Sensor kinase CusS [Pontiella desulfatans]